MSRGRVAVLGGTGFLGAHLCERLCRDGYNVMAFDNFCTSNNATVARLKGRAPSIEVVECDVRKPFDVTSSLDGILHFASPASPQDYRRLRQETLEVNSIGTRNALELAVRNGARFVFASTSEVYGDPQVNPQTEEYFGNVNPIGPRAVYDEGKRSGETWTALYAELHGLDTRIVRIFNTYGPGMRLDDGRAIPNFIVDALAGRPLRIYGDGTQTRSCCYVDDLVDGIVRLFEAPDIPEIHQPINIGNPEELSVQQIAERVFAMVNGDHARPQFTHAPLPANDPKMRQPSIERAQRLLGWKPTQTLDAGLPPTIDYFRSTTARAGAVHTPS